MSPPLVEVIVIDSSPAKLAAADSLVAPTAYRCLLQVGVIQERSHKAYAQRAGMGLREPES